jgi:hypothetical protein
LLGGIGERSLIGGRIGLGLGLGAAHRSGFFDTNIGVFGLYFFHTLQGIKVGHSGLGLQSLAHVIDGAHHAFVVHAHGSENGDLGGHAAGQRNREADEGEPIHGRMDVA